MRIFSRKGTPVIVVRKEACICVVTTLVSDACSLLDTVLEVRVAVALVVAAVSTVVVTGWTIKRPGRNELMTRRPSCDSRTVETASPVRGTICTTEMIKLYTGDDSHYLGSRSDRKTHSC